MGRLRSTLAKCPSSSATTSTALRSRARVVNIVAAFSACIYLLSCAEALGEHDQRRKDPRRHEEGAPVPAQRDPEAALRFGHNILRSHDGSRADALSRFDTSDSDFPTGETLFLLGRAHDEGREDIGIKRDGAAAREMYERAAKLGHPQAQHALSVLLAASAERGEEVEAILYDFFASLGGDPMAHAALGYRYLYGIGTIQNCAQSLQHYQVAARETIADLYAEGRGGIPRPVDRTRLSDRFVAGRRQASDSDRELVDYWEAAAETGDVNSIRTMGVLYQHGARGVEQNLAEAYRLYSEGMKLHDVHSMAYAGNLLVRGAGTSPNYKAAKVIFENTKSDSISLNGLGYLYYHGLEVEQDIVVAYDFFERARKEDKDKNNPDALFNLGMLFLSEQLVNEDGDDVVVSRVNEEGELITLQRDPERALSFLKKAAGLGHVEASFHAGLLYASEEPLSIGNCKTAVSLLKSVVERGPWMDTMKAALHRATAGDFEGALVLYSRLAEIGSEVAQSNAAWLLESGYCDSASINGTEVGCQKRALRLYDHAARQGRASAEMKVGDFHYHGKAGLPVNYEEAARRYLKASEAKHAEALFAMGYMHQTGKGVPQDLFLAKRYFDDAALFSSDAVPVVRLSLFLLRVQSCWMRWRDWWRDLQSVDSESASSPGGNRSSSGNASMSMETFVLVVLAVMLVGVRGERARRERRRQRRDAAA